MNENLKIGDKFIFGEYLFTVILIDPGENYFTAMAEIIGPCNFNLSEFKPDIINDSIKDNG